MTEHGRGAGHPNGQGGPGAYAESTPRDFTRSAVDVLAFERYIADSEGQAAAQSGSGQPQSPYVNGGNGSALGFWPTDTADGGADVLGCLEPKKRGMQGQGAPVIPANVERVPLNVQRAHGPEASQLNSAPAQHSREPADASTDHALQWFSPLASFKHFHTNHADVSVPTELPASSTKAPTARRKTLVSSDLIIKGSPATSQKPSKHADPESIGLAPILSGFDPEAFQESLRFGDTVTIIPDNANGLVAFAGADDARPWLEILDDTPGQHVAVPPNLRDCRWRILPAPLYIEQKKLLKMLSTSSWDEGRGLEMPTVRDHSDLEETASEIIRKNKLSPTKLAVIIDLLVQKSLVQEEKESNKIEQDRVRGNELRYGAAVILVHESTQMVLTATKQRAIEGVFSRPGFHTAHTISVSKQDSDKLSFFFIVCRDGKARRAHRERLQPLHPSRQTGLQSVR